MSSAATNVSPSYAEKERIRIGKYSRESRATANDIGSIPPVANPTRRRACRNDLHLFEQAYFPHSTGLSPFGSAQAQVLERIQGAIRYSSRVLNCEPRGFAKSTKSENAILWAILYGHRHFAVFFGATADDASDAIGSIKKELEDNDRLYEDFPEVCHPIRELGGTPQRTKTQTFKRERTHIEWTADTIVLPVIPGSRCGGSVIQAMGYLSAARGTRHKRTDGVQLRPDLVVCDDPQTDESAVSPAQVAKRKSILYKSILRLGGHGKAVAAVMNATVIADGDMVDQLADHKQHPDWQSVRVKMLPTMPKNIDSLWLDKYKRLRDDYDPEIVGEQQKAHARATSFYESNREAMDEGASVAWQNIPLEAGEVSAVQHAMNIFCDDGEDVFQSECQNEPKRATAAGVARIERADVRERHSGFDAGVAPESTAAVVGHVDVHDGILYWSIAAVKDDFTGYVIDYGTCPEQPSEHFSMYNLKVTLQKYFKTGSVEEAIVRGVTNLGNDLCSRVWATPSGETIDVAMLLWDIGYKPEEVAQGIRLSDFANVMVGSRGVGIGPTETPMTEYDMSAKKVRRCGPDRKRPRWYLPRTGVNGVPIVRFDANYWKSATASRLMQPRNTAGEWSLFGNHRVDHSHYANHLIAEEPIPLTGKGQTVVVWKLRPNHENHWFDTLVGCNLAASMVGIQLPGRAKPKPKKRARRNDPVNQLSQWMN